MGEKGEARPGSVKRSRTDDLAQEAPLEPTGENTEVGENCEVPPGSVNRRRTDEEQEPPLQPNPSYTPISQNNTSSVQPISDYTILLISEKLVGVV